MPCGWHLIVRLRAEHLIFSSLVAAVGHVSDSDCPSLVDACTAAQLQVQSSSCRAPDAEPALAPALVAVLSPDSRRVDSAKGIVPGILDTGAVAMR